MADLLFPSTAELTAIAQDKLPRLQADRPIFDIFPIETVDNYLLLWEQKDNYLGLAQVRGLNGMPARVNRIGAKRYQMQPGVYGEYIPIDEIELTTRRQWGTLGTPVDISDLVTEAQDQLLGRRLDRIEFNIWTLLATGTFSVSGPDGALMHTDSYTTQTYSAGTVWSTAATSTPLADFRAVQLLSRGHSVNFGAGAQAFVNRKQFNRLMTNTNAADLGGRRLSGLMPVNNFAELNNLLTGDDLPNITVYDEGYLDTSGTFQPYIPDGKCIVVGKRPAGQSLGAYRYTRNANNPDLAPGAYMKVIDTGDRNVPRQVEVHDGHNGGVVIYFPSAVVVMSV
jgi:hypothetical protein